MYVPYAETLRFPMATSVASITVSADYVMPTAEQLVEVHTQAIELALIMSERQAGGKSTSG